jgi:hypothetical protein
MKLLAFQGLLDYRWCRIKYTSSHPSYAFIRSFTLTSLNIIVRMKQSLSVSFSNETPFEARWILKALEFSKFPNGLFGSQNFKLVELQWQLACEKTASNTVTFMLLPCGPLIRNFWCEFVLSINGFDMPAIQSSFQSGISVGIKNIVLPIATEFLFQLKIVRCILGETVEVLKL